MVNLSETQKLKILKDILGDSYIKNDECLFYCPECGHHKKKLSVNISKNVFKCWVCDWSSNKIFYLVKKHGKPHHIQQWSRFNDEVEIDKFNKKLFEEVNFDLQQKVDLPEEFISLANKRLPKSSVYALNYLKSRGIRKRHIVRWKIGYCDSGEYENRIIVPSFDKDGDVNYFVTRTFIDDWKKYKNPPISKNVVFNELFVDFDQDVVLVEGVFDAIKAGTNAIPILGSTLHRTSNLMRSLVNNRSKVYMALDPDARDKEMKIIKQLLQYDLEVYKVDISPYEDVGSMTPQEFSERKSNAAFLSQNAMLNLAVQSL